MHDQRPLDCEWIVNVDGAHVCQLCGYVYSLPVVNPPLRRNCPTKMPPQEAPAWGLGDHVGMMFSAMGITDIRVTWFLRAVRAIEEDETCGCEERQKRLNALWAKFVSWARRRGILM